MQWHKLVLLGSGSVPLWNAVSFLERLGGEKRSSAVRTGPRESGPLRNEGLGGALLSTATTCPMPRRGIRQSVTRSDVIISHRRAGGAARARRTGRWLNFRKDTAASNLQARNREFWESSYAGRDTALCGQTSKPVQNLPRRSFQVSAGQAIPADNHQSSATRCCRAGADVPT